MVLLLEKLYIQMQKDKTKPVLHHSQQLTQNGLKT